MDVEVLRWFQQVVDGSTLTEVAARSYLSQSGVSRALAGLELDVGTPLLERSGRLLRVTRAGAVFKEHVDRVIADLDAGFDALARVLDPETGIVSLGFLQSLAAWLVPDLLRSFRATHPHIRVVLNQIGDDLRFALSEGDADLELSSRPVPETGFKSFTLATEPIVLAVADGHPLEGRTSVSLSEVAADAFVAMRPDSTLRRLTNDLCAHAGFEPDVIFEANDHATVRGLVAGGLGVALVPAPRVTAPDTGQGSIHYIGLVDDGAYRHIRMIWPWTRSLSRPSTAFRDHAIHRATSGKLPAVADGV